MGRVVTSSYGNSRHNMGSTTITMREDTSRNGQYSPQTPPTTGVSALRSVGAPRATAIGLSANSGAYNRQAVSGLRVTNIVASDVDAFAANQNMLKTDLAASGGKSVLDTLSRSAGLFEKIDHGPAYITIQVYTGAANDIRVRHETNEFILTGVSEGSQEKFQTFETFDQDFIYFFDRRPHVYTYTGMLINGDDTEFNYDPNDPRKLTMQWKNRFQDLYDTALRGTRCVETGTRAILTYEDVVREGYLLNFSMSENSANTLAIPFTFTMFVVSESNNYRRQQEALAASLSAQ